MDKETLDKIKSDYEDMLKVVKGDYSELLELEKNPIVQRYLYLKGLKESRDLMENGERCIVGKLIDKYGYGEIKSTNGIWCLLFETMKENISDMPVTYFDSTDDYQLVVLYRDIEDSTKLLAVSKRYQEVFEKTHEVVFGNQNILDCSDRYYNLRHEFFKNAILEDQESAKKTLLLQKYNESLF